MLQQKIAQILKEHKTSAAVRAEIEKLTDQPFTVNMHNGELMVEFDDPIPNMDGLNLLEE